MVFPISSKDSVTEFVLADPDTRVRVVDVAGALGMSKGYISKVLKLLKSKRIVVDNSVNISSPEVRAMKIFFNINRLVSKGAIKELKGLDISGAGLYGSWAKGTNTKESDIDIWVKPKGEMREMDVASVQGRLSRALDADVQLLVVSPKRVELLKKSNSMFYYSLVFGSIQLFGETIG